MQNEILRAEIDRQPCLEIITLGRFEVRYGDVLVSEDAKRSYRLWDLFRYLITFRGKGSLPEVMAETLWPDQEYEDPKGAIRTLVYRLRRLLTEKTGLSDKIDFITFYQGGYQWNTKVNYWLDADDFERLCAQAEQTAAGRPEQAIDLYSRALSLYQGEYLPECSYHEWVIPVRHHYHRIYLKAVVELTSLLKPLRRYSEIISVCERALAVEPFEEELHLAFLDALVSSGRLKQARAHYEHITSALYRELGVKPSLAMRSMYRRIQSNEPGVELDLTVIQESLADQQAARGAFLCDPDVFRYLYRLEKRRGERTGQAVFLALLTLARPDLDRPDPETLRRGMDRLEDHLVGSLRKGDVVSRWNEAQFLLIMPGLNMEQAEKVLERIKKGFVKKCDPRDLVLHTKLQSLLP